MEFKLKDTVPVT